MTSRFPHWTLLVLGLLAGCQRAAPPSTQQGAVPIPTPIASAQSSTTATHHVFQPGVAATDGPKGWWATSWTTDEGSGFKGEPANNPTGTLVIRHAYYVVCYDLARRIPLWGAYTVDKSMKTIADSGERGSSKPGFNRPSTFDVEPLVKYAATQAGLPYAKHDDYNDSEDPRYPVDATLTTQKAVAQPAIIQRGHLVPNGAMKYEGTVEQGQQSLRDCFSMANLLPESNAFNAPTWSALEEAVLAWAAKYDRVWIICGPVLTSPNPVRLEGRVNNDDRGVVIPDAVFCILMAKDHGVLHTGAFVIPNVPQNLHFQDYAKSVDDVEAVTHLNFLPELGEPTPVEAETAAWLVGR